MFLKTKLMNKLTVVLNSDHICTITSSDEKSYQVEMLNGDAFVLSPEQYEALCRGIGVESRWAGSETE